MRILHLDSGHEMRGGQWQVLRLMRGLLGLGVHSTLLARADAPLYRMAAAEGFDVRGLAWRNWPRTDVIHAHDARTHTMAAINRVRPLVVSRRVAFPVQRGIFSRWKYARPDRYIAVSRHVADILRAVEISAEQIQIVHDGVPVSLMSDFSGPLVTPLTLDARKGMPLAIEAARAAGRELLCSDNLERDMVRASGFIYLSETEGLGSAILLAMAAGVPVIASRVGGIPEIIAHGENGLLVENKMSAVAAAIRELPARQFSENARQTVAMKFSEGRMVRDTLQVYRDLLHD